MKEVLDDIERWRTAGRRVAIARVVGIEGSSPRDPGATMAVNDAGEVAGSVSGGCVEGAVVQEALAILAGDKERGIVTFRAAFGPTKFAFGSEALVGHGGRGQCRRAADQGDNRRFMRTAEPNERDFARSGELP